MIRFASFQASLNEDIDELHNHLSAHYDVSRYAPREVAAIKTYTDHSENVNKSIRKHAGTNLYKTMPKKHYDIQDGVHSAIARGPALTRPLDVYHGTPSSFHKKVDADGTITTHGLTSTSLSINTARQFTGPKYTSKANILHFKIPAGYKKGIYIQHISSHYDDEREYLLAHDQKWKVGKTYTTVSGHNVTELHPHS